MTTPSPTPETIRPSKSFQVFMGCFGVPFLGLSFVGAWGLLTEGEPIGSTVLYAGAIFGLGAYLVLEAATLRLHLSSDSLWLTRFWHTRWSVPRDCAELKSGRVGDVPVIPGLIVFDRRSGKKVGEIITHQFAASDLARLKADLNRRY